MTTVLPDEDGATLRAAALRLLRRSLHIFPVNAGSCNGCEIELAAALEPLTAHGITLVPTPGEADMILVTGPVTRGLRGPLLAAYAALPPPRLVAALGACACSGGVFAGCYAVEAPLDQLLPVDVYIPGCPPAPDAILHGLLLALGRAEARLRAGEVRPG
jgi:Ni,Fe-hydrogenase III small subunit